MLVRVGSGSGTGTKLESARKTCQIHLYFNIKPCFRFAETKADDRQGMETPEVLTTVQGWILINALGSTQYCGSNPIP